MSAYNQYNQIAFAYDFLAGLVFGKSIQKAQLALFSYLPENGRVLLIGGGTGKVILPLIKSEKVRELVFLEASSAMIKRAIQNTPAHVRSRVRFVLSDNDCVETLGQFDAVLTFFFLDQFSLLQLKTIVQQLAHCLVTKGVWLLSDFSPNPPYLWQRWLQKSMYFFFRFMVRLNARQLEDPFPILAAAGLRKSDQAMYHKGMMYAAAFSKQP